ncbi:dehydrogenase [Sphingomonas sp. Root710]|uniref:SDR family NAD(P)-dependent oxidoreductase n=1 Tax=Sphingomonas sp. Root710 TaxID=1736594 RepID=UPI0006F20882|nr:glucose 1-dehydrogenase [Sphingomonas sp. Root710]KRB82351.1 dehydrogenase [Sphingomonas sp. Root710]
MGQVDGKVAFVTGAASGIGAACASTLAKAGARVIATDIDDILGQSLVDRIRSDGGEAIYLHQDVTDEGCWRDLVADIEKRYGGLDILVANAGIAIRSVSIVDMSLVDWRRQTAINLDGVFLSVKYCLPLMRRTGPGSIIMMSSAAGLRGSANLAGYSATKGAVRLFAKSIAMECAQAADGIRVNSVHPGFVDTPIWEKLSAEQGGQEIAVAMLADEALRAVVPLGRAGRPDEIADGVLFLASDASSYMTGTELVIDGGIITGTGARASAK